MKARISLLLVALSLAGIATATNPFRLTSHADSVNYAFGVGNGTFVRRQVIGADTTNPASIKSFSEGFLAAKGIREDTDEYLRLKAKVKGAEFAIEKAGGFLFGDSSIAVRGDLVHEHFLKGVSGEKWTFQPQQALQYIQSTMGSPARQSGTLSPAVIDSLNMCYGFFEGIQQRQNVLRADSADAGKLKLYIAAYNEGLKMKASDKVWIDGFNIAAQLSQNVAAQPFFVNGTDLRVNLDIMSEGILQAVRGEQTLIAPADAEKFFQNALLQAQAKLNAPLIETGRAFLRENAKRPGVKTTASGLQYEVIHEGTGAKPTANDVVKVHYAGTLIDGKEFDNSYKRGEPIEFPLNRVIKGWTEGLQLMREGGKYKLYIPYELGYGERGAGNDIPPYATLIFEIELIKVTAK